MKFLKLLDPLDLECNDPSAPGRQQRRAFELFPNLVSRSNLHYWRLGDEIACRGYRLLVGLAASYDLKDLRLADIINAELEKHPAAERPTVDVFNIEDCTSFVDLPEFFPDLTPAYHTPPFVGVWNDGVHEQTRCGNDARELILELLNSPMTVAEAVAELTPPDRRLVED
jgi:hypothetical protein